MMLMCFLRGMMYSLEYLMYNTVFDLAATSAASMGQCARCIIIEELETFSLNVVFDFPKLFFDCEYFLIDNHTQRIINILIPTRAYRWYSNMFFRVFVFLEK